MSIAALGTYGNIAASGLAAVTGGNLNVTVGPVFIPGGTLFTVIDAAASLAPLTAPIITDTSLVVGFNADVTSSLGDLILVSTRANPYYTLVSGGNNQAAAVALEKAGEEGPTGDMLAVLTTLDGMGTAKEINDAIGTMIPDASGGAMEASRALASQGFAMISNRLGGARSGTASGVSAGEMLNGVGVWIQGLGSNIIQDSRKAIEGFRANLFGTTIGADKVLDNHYRVGLAGSYGWAGVRSKQPGSPSDNINSYQATIYGSFDSLDLNKSRQGGKKSYEAVRSQVENSWYVDGMVGFTQNNYDSRRAIWLGLDHRVAKSEHYAQQYSTNFEAGYKFVFEETKNLEVTPFVSLGYNYLYMNQYSEVGAGALSLRVDGKGFHQLEQGLGVKLAYPIVAKKVGTFIPSAKAAWLYDYIGDRFETRSSFTGGGPSYATQAAKPAKSGMLFGTELAFLNKGNMTVTGNWDIELKDQYMSNTYYGTARYDF